MNNYILKALLKQTPIGLAMIAVILALLLVFYILSTR